MGVRAGDRGAARRLGRRRGQDRAPPGRRRLPRSGAARASIHSSAGSTTRWRWPTAASAASAIDVKTDEGRDIAAPARREADVFLTNFLPSVLDRLGLGVDELRAVNPRLIYARGHGFGVRGPDADKPAYDATAFWARGGDRGHARRRPDLTRADRPAGRVRRPQRRRAARVRHRRRAVPPRAHRRAVGGRRLAARHGDVDDRPPTSCRRCRARSPAQRPPLGRPRTALPNPLAQHLSDQGRPLAEIWCSSNPTSTGPTLARAIGRAELLADARFADMADPGRERRRAGRRCSTTCSRPGRSTSGATPSPTSASRGRRSRRSPELHRGPARSWPTATSARWSVDGRRVVPAADRGRAVRRAARRPAPRPRARPGHRRRSCWRWAATGTRSSPSRTRGSIL